MFRRFWLWFITCPTDTSATPVNSVDVLASIKFPRC